MARTQDFRLGARVVDRDGVETGTLVSVLVERDGFDAKALVVKDETSLVGRLLADEKLFVTDEVVVPISMVLSAGHHEVRLSASRDEVRGLKPYLSYRLQPEESPEEPLLKESQLLGGGLGMPNVQEVANKPARQIEIDRDENVMIGTSGHRLGKVHDVLFSGDEPVAVVIRPDGLFKNDVLLPIKFIARGDDMALFASITKADAEKLKPFEES
ncbi:MAG TPA: PRC-barrel domain-containing protein [Candidatus Dormibacteraeota bacterium]|nr:PRC-barrel domain-containing protein [Candidatus Dormibacteraeota bacterium]